MANRFLIVCGGSGVGLLGQRQVLNVDGEIHIDVRSEVDDKREERDPENRSKNLRIDSPRAMGATATLTHDMKMRIGVSIPPSSPYARHTEVFTSTKIAQQLKDGLGQMPALGGGAIREETNIQNLDAMLSLMINRWAYAPGPANPLECWIVSSTCGGTGAGTRRFVAERLAELLSNIPGARLELKFICIGALTYSPINPVRTKVNTFFGIAADAALKLQLPDKYKARGLGVTTWWYYVEIPPMGFGDEAKKPRAKLIEMACKAIMDARMQKEIASVANNCDGIGLVRVGFWTKEFSYNVKYAEALRGLVSKLSKLIKPDGYAMYVAGKTAPDFAPGDEFLKVKERLKPDFLAEGMTNKGWQFPRYDERRSSVQRWKESMDELISPDKIDHLVTNFMMPPTGEGQAVAWEMKVPSGDATPYSQDWFSDVGKAHQIKAWAEYGLQGEKGLLARLHEIAKECSNAQHGGFGKSPQTRAQQLAAPLKEFFETLVQVVRWQELQRSAETMLAGTLEGPKKVLATAERAMQGLPEPRDVPVIAAELYEPVEDGSGRSWLRLLANAVARSDPRIFMETVLKGATGLTRLGLTSVLDLPGNVATDDIKEELRKAGKIKEGGQILRAEWWHGTEPPKPLEGGYSIGYRVLPKLEEKAMAEIGDSDKVANLKYLYAGIGMLGLNVLSFDSVSIAPAGDHVTSPAELLKPFATIIKKQLADPNKLFQVVAAGVGGEPLYAPALLGAGLTQDDLDVLEKYFQLGDRPPRVVINAPFSGAQVRAGEDIAIQSTSNDMQGVSRVELIVDGQTVHTASVSTGKSQQQFSVNQTWKATTPDTHIVIVRATNGRGQTGESSISLNVV